ncbi:TPA: hypothetical protein ACMDQU_003665 [Vibrio parahaemolyticus]
MKINTGDSVFVWTVIATVILLAVINNIKALEPLKDQVNGKKGWF